MTLRETKWMFEREFSSGCVTNALLVGGVPRKLAATKRESLAYLGPDAAMLVVNMHVAYLQRLFTTTTDIR